MRKIVFITTSLLISVILKAQKKFNTSIGIEASFPANQPFQKNKAMGKGFFIEQQYIFSGKFLVLLNAGYSYYQGDLVYWDGAKDKNFALIPILAGGRFYIHRVYGEVEAGAAIKASSNTNTLPAVSPAVGIVVNKFDISCRLLGILAVTSIPENTFLQRGGYNYVGIRMAYRFK